MSNNTEIIADDYIGGTTLPSPSKNETFMLGGNTPDLLDSSDVDEPSPESRAATVARAAAEKNPKRRYTALVGFGEAQIPEENKQKRGKYHAKLLRDVVRYWDSTVPVTPYWDKFADADTVYHRIITHSSAIRDSSVNIDDPLDVMNRYGNPMGQFYFKSIPEDDKRRRETIRSEYERLRANAEAAGVQLPSEIRHNYETLLEEPQPSPKTGLYAYSCINPNGMFRAYDYPIVHAFNGISVETSRLVHRVYGTYHDIMQIQNLDTEATLMPLIAFRSDGEMLEVDETDEPQELKNFLLEMLAPSDYVALIECYL